MKVRILLFTPYCFGDTWVGWLRQWTATPLRRVRFPYVSPKQYEEKVKIMVDIRL